MIASQFVLRRPPRVACVLEFMTHLQLICTVKQAFELSLAPLSTAPLIASPSCAQLTSRARAGGAADGAPAGACALPHEARPVADAGLAAVIGTLLATSQYRRPDATRLRALLLEYDRSGTVSMWLAPAPARR